jgi:hypothetical protein
MVLPIAGPSARRTGLDRPDTVTPMSRGPRQLTPLLATAILAVSIVGGCLPSPTSSTSSRPPSLAASARPSPTPRAFVKAIEAFADRVTSGKLTYRVGFKGIARSSTHTLPIAGSMDVAGPDFASSFTYDWSAEAAGYGKVRVQVRGVDDKGYIKSGSGDWRSIKNFGVGQSYVLFKNVKSSKDVRYLGAVRAGGKTYHKVGLTGALLMHPNTLPYLFAKEKVDETRLEVVIDDAGRPRSGTWSMRAQARVGIGDGQLQRLAYDLDLTFSKVGSKISIKRP